jgi:hypothetical protein
MSAQRTLLVLSFDLEGRDPESFGQEVADIVKLIDPPRLPGFTGELRVSVEPVSKQVETWLDDGEPPAPDEPTGGLGPRPARPNTFGRQVPGNRKQRRAERFGHDGRR